MNKNDSRKRAEKYDPKWIEDNWMGPNPLCLLEELCGHLDMKPGMKVHFPDDLKLKEAHWQRDKNLRDILVHLYEWHQLLLDWTSANLGGETKPFLPEPYTWKTYGDMNVKLCEKHQATSYDEAVIMLRKNHAKVMALIESLTDEELFEKKHYPWTGATNIGSYCISATASHYDWAMKKIKQYLKTAK